MAKKRGTRNDDAKARQRAASKAAGLVASPSGIVHGNEEKNQYTLPSSVYKAAVQGKYKQAWQDAVRFRKKEPSSKGNLPYGTPISTPLTSSKMLSSKSAQTRFLASEKNKSGKSTAKNTKRRER